MGIPGLVAARRGLRLVAGSAVVPTRRRGRLLRRLGVTGLNDAVIGHGVVFCSPHSVSVGPGCFINNQVYFDVGPILFGSRVNVGPRTVFVTGRHRVGPAEHRAGSGGHQRISVGHGVWIGSGVTVLPGVTIGSGCVIGAGAVVTADCEPDGLYVGVPARRQRDFELGTEGTA